MDDRKQKVLIIEDDAHLQMIYSSKFKADGFEVHQALSGAQGFRLANEVIPDIILLDIMLPEGMNGFDVLSQLKLSQELKEIPVIMFTNLDSEKDSALSSGAADYVVKANTSIDELVAKVRTHIRKR
jgi:DNA-binding response OmpR family regulator